MWMNKVAGTPDHAFYMIRLFADMTLDDILTEIKLERKRDDTGNQSAVD